MPPTPLLAVHLATITANSGGLINATSSTINLAAITLNSGSSAALTTDVLYNVLHDRQQHVHKRLG